MHLLNAYAEITGTEAVENFCLGFCFGALAILNILTGRDGLFVEYRLKHHRK